MKIDISKEMSRKMLDRPTDFNAQEIPNEIFPETESFGKGIVAMNQSGCCNDFLRHPSKEDNDLMDLVIGEIGIDFDDIDILNYIPDLNALLDDGAASILHTIDSGIEGSKSNVNMSVGTATQNCYMSAVEEINARKMLPATVEPLKTLQLQSEIEQQKTNSQLQEEVNHLQQANSQLQQELNRFKAIEIDSQQTMGILKKMEQQTQPQVDQVSTVDMDRRIHEIDTAVGSATVSRLNYSGLSRKRRPRKSQGFPNERMQQHVDSNNEESIVLQSDRIRVISQEQQDIAQPANKRPPTRNLRNIAKQRKICSQAIVNQNKITEDDAINDYCNMIEHIRVHNDKRYACDVKNCSSIFKSSTALKNHRLAHEGLKPYICNECNRSFREKGTLTKHMLIHTGEKPHLCNVCSVSFRQKGALTKHMLIHSGEKPHLCNVCSVSFREKGALTKHMLIHTGEKPHLCKLCKAENTLSIAIVDLSNSVTEKSTIDR